MSYTPSQMLVISGFMQNKGLQISSALIAALNNYETSGLTGTLYAIKKNAYADRDIIPALGSYMPGFGGVYPTGYLTTGLSGYLADSIKEKEDMTLAVRNRAYLLFKNGIRGFVIVFGAVHAAATAAYDLQGAAMGAAETGFAGMAPGISNYTDQLTGGLSAKFGPTAAGSTQAIQTTGVLGLTQIAPTSGGTTSAAAIKGSLNSVASGIRGMGTLYDVSKPTTLGSPAALITNLGRQGLVNSTSLGRQLSAAGIPLNEVNNQDPNLLKQVLATVTGADVVKITTETKLKVPPGQVINTAADYLDATKILPPAAVAAIPGGTLPALGESLLSIGNNWRNVDEVANAIEKTEVPNLPLLNSLSTPVPAGDMNAIKANTPTGDGTFGNPKVQNFIGTVAGYVHIDQLAKIATAQAQFNSTAAGSNVVGQANAYLAALVQYAIDLAAYNTELAGYDPLGGGPAPVAPTLPSSAPLLAAIANASTDPHSVEANTAMKAMIDQINREVDNCAKGTVDINASTPGYDILASSAVRLTTWGKDTQNLGSVEMLTAMVTNDVYGQAIQAVMLEGRNTSTFNNVGVTPPGRANAADVAKEKAAKTGSGLTDIQKQNVTADAQARGLDVATALANASKYGYNSGYYENLGYPAA